MVHPDSEIIRAVWTVWLVTWVVLAFRNKRTVARRGSVRVFVLIAFVALIAASGSSRSRVGWHHQYWFVTSTLSVLATSLVVLGAAFAIWARLTIGTNWSGTITLKENHELVVRGPYRLVRHPIYTGLIAMGLGSIIIYAQPIYFLEFAFGTVMLVMRIPVEERLMTETFPDQYPQYRQRVKALLPFIW
ncbi:MAG: methyltransferase family protein [Acidimicrobiales bacterium]